jgi:hypothetical protein
VSELPSGFDGVYSCQKHPEREVVAPIACRRCQECHDNACRNYAEYHGFHWQDHHNVLNRKHPYDLDHSEWHPRKDDIL